MSAVGGNVHRLVTISMVQTGPLGKNKRENVKNIINLINKASEEHPDFIVFPELCTTPYFPTGGYDREFFNWAETIPGETTNLVSKKAKSAGCIIVLPVYEKGKVEGMYYNSVALIGQNGELMYGTLPNSTKVHCYRKNHLSKESFRGFTLDETFYMGLGFGFPVFATKKAKVGILICRDRWFPESWRSLALQGAEIIFCPTASSGMFSESYIRSLRTWSQENQLFAVGCNKVGTEKVERLIHYFGSSCIVGPMGEIIAQVSNEKEQAIITATIDLSEIQRVRRGLPNYKDRRPNLYGIVTQLC